MICWWYIGLLVLGWVALYDDQTSAYIEDFFRNVRWRLVGQIACLGAAGILILVKLTR